MAKKKDSENPIDDFPKIDMEAIRKKRYTYEWQFYSDEYQMYIEYTEDGPYQNGALVDGEKQVSCVKVNIFRLPENPPWGIEMRHHNAMLNLRVRFFNEVFNERSLVEGYGAEHKYSTISLPEPILKNILNTINDFGLLHIRDLILEIIAFAQHMYVEEIAFWEKPAQQKLIKTAHKEADKVKQIFDNHEADYHRFKPYKEKIRPHLEYINFVFNTGTIKIEHEWLKMDFIKYTLEHYDKSGFKNWEKELSNYSSRFDRNAHKSKFKYNLAISYYNLLTKPGFFKISEEIPYPNELMLCIAKLMEFSLIQVGNWEDSNNKKTKHIRNWIDRNTLDKNITYLEIPTDLERLKKYFESNFIDMAESNKRADAISIAVYICKRFDIQVISNDLVHIATCIMQTNWLVGHQMTSNVRTNEPEIPEVNAFRKLMNGVKNNQKISSIKFTLEGDDTEHELSQRLPLYLIEEALKTHYYDNQIDFDADAIPTTFKKNDSGSISIYKEPRFNLPHERHLVRLVHSLYNFLKDHSGIEEGKYLKGEDYYEIIASLFNKTHVFYMRVNEYFAIEKIKQWHSLNPES